MQKSGSGLYYNGIEKETCNGMSNNDLGTKQNKLIECFFQVEKSSYTRV